MYDFGFYLEHSVYFREYLENKFANRSQINHLSDFDEIIKDFEKSPLCNKHFKNISIGKDHLIAFGIRFETICDVELDSSESPLEDAILGKHYRFSQNTKDSTKNLNGGTYIWCFDGKAKYVGEADNMEKRLKGYSDIPKYAVENNQQTTNRHMNAEICKAINDGTRVTLYFYQTENHHDDVELYLLKANEANKCQHFNFNKKDKTKNKR